MSTFLWSLLQGILIAVIPVLTAFVVAWIRQKTIEVSKGLTADQLRQIEWAINVAVNAAEQAGANKLITDKKAYALQTAQAYLDHAGIKVDVALLEGLIENSVKTELIPIPPVVPPAA